MYERNGVVTKWLGIRSGNSVWPWYWDLPRKGAIAGEVTAKTSNGAMPTLLFDVEHEPHIVHFKLKYLSMKKVCKEHHPAESRYIGFQHKAFDWE
jgi:hypothetical protein